MSANADPNRPLYWISQSELQSFRKVYHVLRFITTSIHELLGHGTGKLLTETSPDVFNFNSDELPINTFTGKPVELWYKHRQTWTSVFEKLAGTVEECRAMLISYYLADSKDMLRMYGYDDNTDITADEHMSKTYSPPNTSFLKPRLTNFSPLQHVYLYRISGHPRITRLQCREQIMG